MKSYTDLEQSKVLAKILPLESADMRYLKCDFEDEREYSILVGLYHEGYVEREDGTIFPVFDKHIPCWSLAALLKVIRKTVGYELLYNKISITIKCELGDNPWSIEINENSEVDACYEMIIKLHELKML